MKKKRKKILIALLGILLIGGIIYAFGKKEIFYGRFDFTFGSRGVIIYDNGRVYEDFELEEPNHKEKYKYFKTLSFKELKELKQKLKTTDKDEELKLYVIRLIYGVDEFDDLGNYKDKDQ